MSHKLLLHVESAMCIILQLMEDVPALRMELVAILLPLPHACGSRVDVTGSFWVSARIYSQVRM